jgi:hypothetical protein
MAHQMLGEPSPVVSHSLHVKAVGPNVHSLDEAGQLLTGLRSGKGHGISKPEGELMFSLDVGLQCDETDGSRRARHAGMRASRSAEIDGMGMDGAGTRSENTTPKTQRNRETELLPVPVFKIHGIIGLYTPRSGHNMSA